MLVIGLCTLLGFGLRVLHLDGPSLWFDELYSVDMARRGVVPIVTQLVGDHVPLHFLLLAGWSRVAGDSAFASRYLSLAFGVLSLPAGYKLLRQLLGPASALIGCAALAVSGSLLYYSQEVRPYSLAVLLLVVSAYWLVLSLSQPSRSRWLAYSASAALGLYAYYYVAPALFALNLPVLFTGARKTRGWWFANAVPLGLWLPWPLLTLERALNTLAARNAGPAPANQLISAAQTLAGTAFGPTASFELSLAPAAALLLLVVTGAWLVLRSRRLGLRLLAAWGLLLPLLTSVPALALDQHPVYVTRYYLLGFPAWLALGLLAIERTWRGRQRWLAAGAALCFLAPTAVALTRNFTNPDQFRDNYRQVFSDLQRQAIPGETLIYDVPDQSVVVNYYDRSPIIPAIGLPAESAAATQSRLQTLASSGEGVWALLYGEPDPTVERWLDTHFVTVSNRWYGPYVRLKHYAAEPRPATGVVAGARSFDGLVLDGLTAEPVPGSLDLAIRLAWRAGEPLPALRRSVQLLDEHGDKISQIDGPPVSPALPTTGWSPELAYDDFVRLPINQALPPGAYTLGVAVYQPGLSQSSQFQPLLQLARLSAAVSLPIDGRTSAGWDITQATVGHGSGGEWLVRLDGIVDTAPSEPYTWFVHALDADGKLLAQDDHPPLAAGGNWKPGDSFSQIFRFAGSPEIATLEVGAYDARGKRVAFGCSGCGDHILLAVPASFFRQLR